MNSKDKFWGFFLVILGIIVFGVSNGVSADVITDVPNKVAISVPVKELKIGETVTKETIMPDGQKATILITKESGDIEFRSTFLGAEKVGNGTYKVHVFWGIVNAGFRVDINTRNITSAHSLWYYNFAVSSANLVRESNKRACAYFNLEHALPWFGGPSYNVTLEAVMDADHLVTYFG